ncbi:TPA: LPXTG cell wall anchor domain-containing protein [Enterococcus faecalis]
MKKLYIGMMVFFCLYGVSAEASAEEMSSNNVQTDVAVSFFRSISPQVLPGNNTSETNVSWNDNQGSKIYRLPNTGYSFNSIYEILGITCLSATVLILYKRKKSDY